MKKACLVFVAVFCLVSTAVAFELDVTEERRGQDVFVSFELTDPGLAFDVQSVDVGAWMADTIYDYSCCTRPTVIVTSECIFMTSMVQKIGYGWTAWLFVLDHRGTPLDGCQVQFSEGWPTEWYDEETGILWMVWQTSQAVWLKRCTWNAFTGLNWIDPLVQVHDYFPQTIGDPLEPYFDNAPSISGSGQYVFLTWQEINNYGKRAVKCQAMDRITRGRVGYPIPARDTDIETCHPKTAGIGNGRFGWVWEEHQTPAQSRVVYAEYSPGRDFTPVAITDSAIYATNPQLAHADGITIMGWQQFTFGESQQTENIYGTAFTGGSPDGGIVRLSDMWGRDYWTLDDQRSKQPAFCAVKWGEFDHLDVDGNVMFVMSWVDSKAPGIGRFGGRANVWMKWIHGRAIIEACHSADIGSVRIGPGPDIPILPLFSDEKEAYRPSIGALNYDEHGMITTAFDIKVGVLYDGMAPTIENWGTFWWAGGNGIGVWVEHSGDSVFYPVAYDPVDSTYKATIALPVLGDGDYYTAYGWCKSDSIEMRTVEAMFSGVVEVGDNASTLPGHFTLYQNYPNPFNAWTTITFDIERDGPVSLSIYNAAGQEVDSWASWQQAGKRACAFDMTDLSSGVYFYRLIIDRWSATRKMILLK